MIDKSYRNAFITLIIANLIWGSQAIFWKFLSEINLNTILVHRIIWGAFFCILLMCGQKRWNELKSAVRSPKDILFILINSALLAGNWLIFIWLINIDKIVELSLGHFMSPLLVILFGRIIYKEHCTRGQITALLCCLSAIIYQSVTLGTVPLNALAVAAVFSLFALSKKMSHLKPLPSMTIDVVILSIITLIWVASSSTNHFSFPHTTHMLFACGGLITVLPMIFYAHGARVCGLKVTGLLQYMAPILSLLIGVLIYNEPFGFNKIVTFSLIWTGLSICTFEAFYRQKNNRLKSS